MRFGESQPKRTLIRKAISRECRIGRCYSSWVNDAGLKLRGGLSIAYASIWLCESLVAVFDSAPWIQELLPFENIISLNHASSTLRRMYSSGCRRKNLLNSASEARP